MIDHMRYLEEMGMTASEWGKFTNDVAQELVAILQEMGCTYHDGKSALCKASSILERTMLKAKV